MKLFRIKIFLLPVLIIAVSMLFLSLKGNKTDTVDRDLLMQVIYFTIQNGHYDPGEIDDEFSEKAFKVYLENMDYRKRFLMENDVQKLKKYQHKIDDELKENGFEFFDLSVQLLNERKIAAKEYYLEILSNPFDYTTAEEVEVDPEKIDFVKSKKDLKERWRQLLKWEVLGMIDDLKSEQEADHEKNDTVILKDFTELEAEAREKILSRYNDWFHRMDKLGEQDHLVVYINSLLAVLDPHTSYFPPKDKENFDIRFAGKLEGIGAQLTQKNMYVEVTRIIPGSPSWKDGRLEVGDYILKVREEGAEAVDIVDMRLDEAVQLIRGNKGTTVYLTVKKKIDGSVEEISLVRDVVKLEETYAKSSLISEPGDDKQYGYIKLPSFYVDFNNKESRDCYKDVRNELNELINEGIDGLVFDLRDNSGGSLQHVVKIVGLFIEKGPVVQAKTKFGKPKILKDYDPEVLYDGPVIVMVNALSASASEIFAAAMQDYDRAIIVGGNSTFGKGTVQSFTNLNDLLQVPTDEMEDLGSVKLTIQKFYRVDGSSTQLKGVTPDIIMPDYYNYMEIGEKDMDFPMEWDELSPTNTISWIPPYNEQRIIELSKQRMGKNSTMQLIKENGQRLKEIRENSTVPLDADHYFSLMEQRDQESEKYESIGKDTLDMEVHLSKIDMLESQTDSTSMAIAEEWMMDIKKDIYLFESVKVLDDMINQQQSAAKND